MERRPWTAQEDQLLKNLYQKVKLNKWSLIARRMEAEFLFPPRTGKQCRQRYNNHLDPLTAKQTWNQTQQSELLRLHNQLGNKWAVIALRLGGRTDNSVKNHFFAKLRKSMRRINKVIQQRHKKTLREIKLNVLYKIIEASEQKFKKNPLCSAETSRLSCIIKNKIIMFSNEYYTFANEEFVEFVKQVQQFGKEYKRKPKQLRRVASQNIEVEDDPIVKQEEFDDSQSDDSEDEIDHGDHLHQQPKEGGNSTDQAESKMQLRSKNIILVQPTMPMMQMKERTNIEDLLQHQGILQEQNSPLLPLPILIKRSTSSEYQMQSSQREHFFLQESANEHNLPTPVFDYSCKKQSQEEVFFK